MTVSGFHHTLTQEMLWFQPSQIAMRRDIILIFKRRGMSSLFNMMAMTDPVGGLYLHTDPTDGNVQTVESPIAESSRAESRRAWMREAQSG